VVTNAGVSGRRQHWQHSADACAGLQQMQLTLVEQRAAEAGCWHVQHGCWQQAEASRIGKAAQY